MHDVVDLSRFPIHEPSSAGYRAVVAETRAALAEDGCAVLRGFLAPSVELLERETNDLAPKAYVKKRYGNPYSSPDDPSLPEDHPVRTFLERTNAFVAGDLIPESSPLKRLYHFDAFKRFVAECVSEEEIFEYDDPLAGLVVNVLKPGWQHPWHYDTNEFIVSTLTQGADEGGIFEYCPRIRSPESEEFDRVRAVLKDEDRSEVKQLELVAGDIQIFFGRYSLHRVTRVGGQRARHSAIFAYAKEPGVIGKPERTKHLFGRLTPVHEQASHRADGLLD